MSSKTKEAKPINKTIKRIVEIVNMPHLDAERTPNELSELITLCRSLKDHTWIHGSSSVHSNEISIIQSSHLATPYNQPPYPTTSK